MKALSAIAILSLFTLGACSTSDDANSEPVATETDYFPTTAGNYWVYKVSGGDFESQRDSLYTANDTVISGKTYKNFKTKNPAVGFYSASASKNSARKVGDKIVITGSGGLNFASALPVEIALVDFVVFKQGAPNNETLDTRTGSLQRDFNGFPLTITYELKTVASEDMASFSAPDGKTYTDVKPVSTILNLKITTTIGNLPITVLPSQNVLVSKQYYAKNKGVVYTKTTASYELAELGVELDGIPQNYSQESEEILDIYVAD